MNNICGCGHCHQWAHANPADFENWYAEKFPEFWAILNIPLKHFTWREDDFKKEERRLLLDAIELNVDPMHVPSSYRGRFMRRISDMKG